MTLKPVWKSKFYGAFVESSLDLHKPSGRVHLTHWLISTQASTAGGHVGGRCSRRRRLVRASVDAWTRGSEAKEDLALSGERTRSKLWLQMHADACGRDVVVCVAFKFQTAPDGAKVDEGPNTGYNRRVG